MVPLKQIRVASGDELKRMCAPMPCKYPERPSIFQLILNAIGTAFKVLIAGSLIYVTYDAGLWSDADKTEELYKRFCRTFGKKSTIRDANVNITTDECKEEEDMICKVSQS